MSASLPSFLLLTSLWLGSILFPEPAGTFYSSLMGHARRSNSSLHLERGVTIAGPGSAIQFREHLRFTCKGPGAEETHTPYSSIVLTLTAEWVTQSPLALRLCIHSLFPGFFGIFSWDSLCHRIAGWQAAGTC
jgi:hypothetical protein